MIPAPPTNTGGGAVGRSLELDALEVGDVGDESTEDIELRQQRDELVKQLPHDAVRQQHQRVDDVLQHEAGRRVIQRH